MTNVEAMTKEELMEECEIGRRRNRQMEARIKELEAGWEGGYEAGKVWQAGEDVARLTAAEAVVEAARGVMSYGWWDTNVKPYTKLLTLEHALSHYDEVTK